jgi:hypothetical protein
MADGRWLMAMAIGGLRTLTIAISHGGERQGSSRVPIGVHGLQRAMRFTVFHPPRTTPSRATTASA